MIGVIAGLILAFWQFFPRTGPNSRRSASTRRLLGAAIVISVVVPGVNNVVTRWKVEFGRDEDVRIERIVRKALETAEVSQTLLSAVKPVDVFVPPQLAATEGGALSPEKNREVVNMIVDLLRKFDKSKVLVEAYSDVDHTEAPVEYNLVVSERRGLEVKNYLVSKGISAERITLIAYGNGRPLASGRDVDARRLNNRVRFVFGS